MIVLGIETSCDETSIAFLKAEKNKNGFFIMPLGNAVASQIKIHNRYGGIVPMLASREHVKNIAFIAQKAAEEVFGKKNFAEKINLIAATKGPGLIPSLLVGVNFAKALAFGWNKPLIGVNHLEGHLYSFLLPKNKEKKLLSFAQLKKIFPAVCLLVSGGHTQLIYLENLYKFKVIGETRDDAAGECFDKGARILGLSYPGGPAIANEAAKYRIQDTEYKIQRLPRPMADSDNYDFSFSGLKTALLYLTQKLGSQKTKKLLPALAFEFQEAIVDTLIKKTFKAIKTKNPKSLILAGGVSANQQLRNKFKEELKKENLKINFFAPELEYATDNAIMIALAGFLNYERASEARKRRSKWKNLKADANLKL